MTGLWTLTGWTLSSPEQQTNFVEVPGRRGGLLDLSTALTDGEPIYNSRTLKATFESSEGTRLEREDRINTMLNTLDGYSMKITLPDDTTHYMVGRVTVKKNYNDDAHASVEVSAVCEPWRYSTTETKETWYPNEYSVIRTFTVTGRVPVTPRLEVSDVDEKGITVKYGGAQWVLPNGTHIIPSIVFKPGENQLTAGKTTGYMSMYFTEGEL